MLGLCASNWGCRGIGRTSACMDCTLHAVSRCAAEPLPSDPGRLRSAGQDSLCAGGPQAMPIAHLSCTIRRRPSTATMYTKTATNLQVHGLCGPPPHPPNQVKGGRGARVSAPTSAPGLAHICAAIGPHRPCPQHHPRRRSSRSCRRKDCRLDRLAHVQPVLHHLWQGDGAIGNRHWRASSATGGE
jgi:hypothetical protein